MRSTAWVREVRGEHGSRRGYDVLLLATGSNPVIPPIPGTEGGINGPTLVLIGAVVALAQARTAILADAA